MKYTSILFVLLTAVAVVMLATAPTANAQLAASFGEEPSEMELNAPIYPGALFIRKTVGLDPLYETAMYITLAPMEMVEDFFARKLPEKRFVYFSDKEIHLTAYLLKTWSKFPGEPKREDLVKLESEPSVQFRTYDPAQYAPLAEYFDKLPDGKAKANVIRSGKTMILYTYEASEKDRSTTRVVGTWTEVSRDLAVYSGSVLELRADGTYTFTFTDGNLDALAKEMSKKKPSAASGGQETLQLLKGRNPEKGKYVILRNSITMVSDNPLDGMQTKSGLIKASSATLSLELINKPRLTFLNKQ